jgi:CDGSH-type Zn-finger protein
MESNNGVQEHQLKEELKILSLPNGPYYLLNDMEPKVIENLQNSEVEPLSTLRGVALCRCEASKNKPFCDGTHGTIGCSIENKTLDDSYIIKDKGKNYVGKEITIHDNRKICSHAAECVNNLPSVFKSVQCKTMD